MKFIAHIFATEEKKAIKPSTLEISTESGITVADVKAQCYASLKLAEGKTYEKVSEEVWVQNVGFNKENKKPAPAADDFVLNDVIKYGEFGYYVTLKEKK